MHSGFKASLESSLVIDRNGYSYFIHPLTDGIPAMDPNVLNEVVEWLISAGNFDCDYILAPESMAIPLAVPVSMKLGIPYSVIRKRCYGIEGEVLFEQKTGYSSSMMAINGIKKGDRVVIVDDVVSTGGTLDSIIKTLKNKIGAEIVDVLVPINKGTGTDVVLKETGITVKTMVNVVIVDGKVRVN